MKRLHQAVVLLRSGPFYWAQGAAGWSLSGSDNLLSSETGIAGDFKIVARVSCP